jgi:hypothetical protein
MVAGAALLLSGVEEGAGTRMSEESLANASLIQLIATPERFDGKRVRVLGFAHLEFEGDALYLHREDMVAALAVNAVGLEIDRERSKALRNSYVIVEGRFKALGRTSLNFHAGQIIEISRFERLPTRAEFEAMGRGQ